MKKILRQTALGFGTFGTGCALLALNVNPYLLVLTDTVVGVGMLFAAGSISVNDLPLRTKGTTGDVPAESVPGAGDEPQAGLMASLGKLKGSLKPPAGVKGKEVQEAKVKEIDRMLDSTLAGPSKRLISLAEGKGPSTAPAAAAGAAAGSTGHGEDLLEQFSKSEIGIPFGDEDDEAGPGLPGQTGPAVPEAGMLEARPGQLTMAAEVTGEAPVEVPSHPVEGLGADDLLSALRLEAMKEKKKDDTSLVRDLHGVKVTGKELVDELSSLVRNMRGR
jgi:hypothetical protein